MPDSFKTKKQLLRELGRARELNSELREQVGRARLEIAAMLSASRSVSEFTDFRTAARAIFGIAKELIGASSGYVALLSDDGSENEVLFLDSGGMPCSVDPELPMPIRGLRGEAYRDGKVVYDNQFASSEWKRFMPGGHVALENVLFAPMAIEDKVVGLIGLANKEGGFTEDDARLATVFGDLAAVALSNDYTFESLERSEERFRSVTQSANDAIVSADSGGKIISWNKGAQAIFGYDEAVVLGRELTILMPRRYQQAHNDALRQYLQTGIPRVIGHTVEMHGMRQDGTEFPLELSLSSWKTKDGTFFTGIIRDITERRRSEALSDALNDINETVNATLEADDILRNTMIQASEVLGSKQSFITVPEGQGWVIRQVHGFPHKMVDTRLNAEEAEMMSRAVAQKIASGLDMAPGSGAGGTFSLEDTGSLLLIPLRTMADVLGVLAISYPQEGKSFSAAELDFAGKLSSSISLSLKNAHLYMNELESRGICQSYANQLSVLHRISLSLNRETDKKRLLKTVLRAAVELTSAGVGVMTLIQDGQTELVSDHYAPWYKGRCALTGDISKLHQRVTRLLPDQDNDSARIAYPSDSAGLPSGHVELRGLLVGIIRDTKGRIRGMFMLSSKAGDTDFTTSDEEVIALLAAQSSVALHSAETFEREHVVAETLQDALLPDAPLRDDIDVGLLYQSAGSVGKVGGDFYDIIELDDNRVAVAVGDVCGKGLSAATYTAMMKYTLRAFLEEGMLPGECLIKLNRLVQNEIPIDKFITVSLLLIDPPNGAVSYSSAGHPAPIVCQHGQAAPLPLQPAVPLGVVTGQQYQTDHANVAGGSSIVLFTDGLIEARAPGSEPFGETGVTASIVKNSGLPARRMAEGIINDALEFSQDFLRDDIALMVLKLS